MASTAPTLTWNMTAIRVPVTPTDADSILNTIKLCVDDATYWELDAGAFGGGGAVGDNYRIFTPVGGNQPNMQVVVCHSPDDAMILGTGNPGLVTSGNFGNHTNVNKATSIFIGLCPEGGADFDPLLAAGPTNGVERFTKYWKISDDLVADQWNQVFCLNSDESLGFWGNEIASEDWYGGIAGAILDPPLDADGEGTPGRLYGMLVTGKTLIPVNYWNSESLFTSSNNSQDREAVGVFDPNALTSMTVVQHMVRAQTTAPRYLTIGGTQISMPYAYWQTKTPFSLFGIGRQMRLTTDGFMREVIQDSGANDKSYRIGQSTLAVGDCVSFDNG